MTGFAPDLLECRERGLNALALVLRDQARKHLSELRVLSARVDVLPPVGLEERGFDGPRLALIDCAAAPCREVAGVGLGLPLQDAVHGSYERNEIVDRLVACLRR